MCAENFATPGMIMLSYLVTYPLVPLFTLFQLSVRPHRDFYKFDSRDTKSATISDSKDLKTIDKRNAELLFKAGATVKTQPYQAPVYLSYRELVKSLQKQGWKGFYKGFFAGMIVKEMQFYNVRANEETMILRNISNISQGSLFVFLYFSNVFSDFFAHIFRVAQTRFIIQNPNKEFSIFKGYRSYVFDFPVRKLDFFTGFGTRLPANAFEAASLCLVMSKNYFLSYIIWFLSYPIETVGRRLECQINKPGMIPMRYKNTFHALKLITKEEGFRGLYRGFPIFFAHRIAFTQVFNSLTSLGRLSDENY